MNTIKTAIFNQPHRIVEGWYWLLPSQQLKIGKPRALNLMGKEFVIYRGQNGKVVVLDAYCPHMGAHLAEGKVEGNELRCFFHNWKFSAAGQCVEIPCLEKLPDKIIAVHSWYTAERYSMIWIWLGNTKPLHDIPEVTELAGKKISIALGNHFEKNCHPNVVMINAIDEQHFRTVHKLPGSLLRMEPKVINQHNILFENVGRVPETSLISRLIAKFYRGPLTYNLSYWYGHVGTTSFGPDFLHLHLMFALRPTKDGKTEGQTIVFTKYRKGILGWLFNKFILFITKLGGYYFAKGDTRVFQTICFDFKTPIQADRAVIFFIKHLEQQASFHWSDLKDAEKVCEVA